MSLHKNKKERETCLKIKKLKEFNNKEIKICESKGHFCKKDNLNFVVKQIGHQHHK